MTDYQKLIPRYTEKILILDKKDGCNFKNGVRIFRTIRPNFLNEILEESDFIVLNGDGKEIVESTQTYRDDDTVTL